jgi:hypothetical protein
MDDDPHPAIDELSPPDWPPRWLRRMTTPPKPPSTRTAMPPPSSARTDPPPLEELRSAEARSTAVGTVDVPGDPLAGEVLADLAPSRMAPLGEAPPTEGDPPEPRPEWMPAPKGAAAAGPAVEVPVLRA